MKLDILTNLLRHRRPNTVKENIRKNIKLVTSSLVDEVYFPLTKGTVKSQG